MNKAPQDFTGALVKAGLGEFFLGRTAAHQREYLKWIEEAKRPETRRARIGQAMTMLAEKRTKENARSKK
jgi:uncharacterized protein YdeI (YjbR/CyaY-like superfamily)